MTTTPDPASVLPSMHDVCGNCGSSYVLHNGTRCPTGNYSEWKAPSPAAVVDYPHIKEPYTLEEIEAKIASHDYGAEHLLQHAMLLLRARPAAEPVGYVTNDEIPEHRRAQLLPGATVLAGAALYAAEPSQSSSAGEAKECRHCGWLCAPNTTPKRAWYPLAAPTPAEPATLTPEEHQVLRSAVRDSAEVVAPGRMEESAKTEAPVKQYGIKNIGGAFDEWEEFTPPAAIPEAPAAPGADGSVMDEQIEQVPEGYSQTVIDALYEQGDPVSVDAAEEIQRLVAALAATAPLVHVSEAPAQTEADTHEFAVRLSEYGLAMEHRNVLKACVLAGVLKSMYAASIEPESEADPVQQEGGTYDKGGSGKWEPVQQDTEDEPSNDTLEAAISNTERLILEDLNPTRVRNALFTLKIRLQVNRIATPPAEKQTWAPDQVERVEKEAESMLGKLQASPQAPSGGGPATPGDQAIYQSIADGYLSGEERAHSDGPMQIVSADPTSEVLNRQTLIDWVCIRWHDEVAHRPMVNIHRRSLDDAWRQMLRHLGVDDRARLGPTHDELRAKISSKEWDAMNGASTQDKGADNEQQR